MDFFNQVVNSELLPVIGTACLLLLFYWLFDRGHLGIQAMRSFNHQSRQRWVNSILQQSGTEILAVQVLRNSIMTATVMASTCVLFVIAIMSLISDTDKFASHWLEAATVQGMWRIKVGLLLLTVFLAFWHYAQAIRLYGHVGYLLGMTKQSSDDMSTTARQAISFLNTAGHMFSSGNRYFFFSLALVLWWFGLVYFFLGTISLALMGWWLERRALPGNL
ncbi:putative membrane protein [Oxalobacteraceae bacterium GrIS 2.11]